ncbi:hypothetical protein K461DRAFT_294181 [Myriangium duriaei CBS 260.36]|uniref:FAM50A/XAP5 C-terminal domain-containing protein n=1 Tax=Myriangium duriaei CBS 260.36 TaxID=1168546 RepID=A0A9P4J522_9PEZI|nr:hypothetical protein K461DRAFT_294181 [Myriangium duriaei CBS 260.36]
MSGTTPAHSTNASGTSTPASRFRSQNATGEEALKSNTVGLVTLSDFRKRRAEALDTPDSRASTPTSDAPLKKKKRKPKKGGLSFDDDDEASESPASTAEPSRASTPAASTTPRLAANATVSFLAKSQTKSALAREAAVKDSLRREFVAEQARVRATPFVLPFVFFDGADAVGGKCRVTKGEQVWRFLERARKVGAESGGRGLKVWGRVSVDDLMLVVDDVVLAHHYEFYYFMLNGTNGFTRRLFAHKAEPTAATPSSAEVEEAAQQKGGLTLHGELRKAEQRGDEAGAGTQVVPDAELEGFNDDPGLVKVVDRRWYERNKHVFPMSAWQDFDPEKDFGSGSRKDAQGNAYFAASP